MTWSSDDLNIELLAPILNRGIHQTHQGRKVVGAGHGLRQAEKAFEIVKINALRKGATALTFNVLADVMLGSFEQAVPVFAVDVEEIGLSHAESIIVVQRCKPDRNAGLDLIKPNGCG